MPELEPQKFQYKKDHHDVIYIGIVALVVVMFAGLYLSGYIYDQREIPTGLSEKNNIDALLINERSLEEQLREYEENTEFEINQ